MRAKIKNKLIIISVIITLVFSGIAMILYTLSDHIRFFYTPSEIPSDIGSTEFRIGGVVESGSLKYISPSEIEFIIYDYDVKTKVKFTGILPSLFREEQAIVAKGHLLKEDFIAKEILAKHDENYKPVKK